MPGIKFPGAVQSRIAGAGAAAPAEGVRLAGELLRALAGEIQGIYLMPAFQRFDLAAEVVDIARRLPAKQEARGVG